MVKGQLTGMRGVYLVAAKLSELGFVVSPTSRSAQGADLLVTDTACTATFAVQVKTNARTFNFWLMGKKNQEMVSKTLVYVLVNLKKKTTEYYVVPSEVVAENIQVDRYTKPPKNESADAASDALAVESAAQSSTWYFLRVEVAKPYQDKWEVFEGTPSR